MPKIKIGNRPIGGSSPTYFIAEIGANHEGSFEQAVRLIKLAAAAGANAVKFQHYRADTLASKEGFARLASLAHYKDNPHTVFGQYEVPWGWTAGLKAECELAGVGFMSTPYDLGAVDHLDPYVSAFKIGSGDITYEQLVRHVADKGKVIVISTGASTLSDVLRVMEWVPDEGVCLMQCNTNYTASFSNYNSLNLRVLETYAHLFPYTVLGLSDHTTNLAPVLGAVTLGVRVIERHFTDSKEGHSPDRPFAITPMDWADMVRAVRTLEATLGDGNKRVEPNEAETVVLQRRCLRAARPLAAGTVLAEGDVAALRPAPAGSLPPYEIEVLIGRVLQRDMIAGEEFTYDHVR